MRNVRELDSIQTKLDYYRANDNLEGQMIALKYMGKRQRELNEFIDAIASHTQQQELASRLCDTTEIIYALNNIGTNYRRMSMLEDATTFHYHALKYCEMYSDQESYSARKNRVTSLNGIGNISLRLGDYETADSVFRAALKGEAELGSALGQAINYANLGAIFEYNNQLDSAWLYYKKSMDFNKEAKSDMGIALCHCYFGSLYEKENNYTKAIDEYEKAYNMEGDIDTWHWLNSCLSLAQLHIKLGNNETATSLLFKAEKEALDGNSRDHLTTIYALLSDLHDKAGQTQKAFDFYRMSREYNDSIVSEKNLIQIQNERVQYEYQRRQQEVDILRENYDKEKASKSIIIWSMIAIATLLVAVIVLLLYSLRMKKKSHKALQEIDQVKSSFFTNITHEFRTPLTVIIGLAEEIAKETDVHARLAQMGETIARHGKNLLTLINQILDITKMKSVTNDQEYKHGDIAGHIHTVVESVRELAKRKHISLLFSPSQPQIFMDFVPEYINRIITNLVANAIKFTPENGRIYITATVKEDNLELCIADNGCGISRKEIPYIFDVFYQGQQGKIEVGSGIGLSLVRQLIESMNGSIALHSAEEEGSIFIITLPLKQGGIDWDQIDESEATQSATTNNFVEFDTSIDDEDDDDQLPTILVVEDNMDIMTYIGSIIKNAHIHYAHDGIDGIEKALNIVPDIIITDIMMPKMDGLEMARRIRQSELLNHIPIIAITAKTSEKDKIDGVKAGINYYINKPFSSDELNAIILNTLQLRRRIQDNCNRVDSDEVTKDNHQLSNADQIFLTRMIDIVHTQMSQHNVNTAEIAEAMCLSTKQLNRKVIAITGESVARYILIIRMNKAKKLLDSTKGYSVSEVAYLCGYEEGSNFTRAFKQVYGVTPTQYTRQPQ